MDSYYCQYYIRNRTAWVTWKKRLASTFPLRLPNRKYRGVTCLVLEYRKYGDPGGRSSDTIEYTRE